MVYDKKETSRKKHIYDRRKKNDVRKLETRARLRGVSIVRMGAWHKSTFWMSRLKCLLTSFGKNGGGKVTTQPRKCQLPVVPYDLGQFQTKAANWKIPSPLFSPLHSKNTNYKWLKEKCFHAVSVAPTTLHTWVNSKVHTQTTFTVWIFPLSMLLCWGHFYIYCISQLIQIIVRLG